VGKLVGLISDTHGLVRPSVSDALRGVDLILHAGDVGEGVLAELEAIAPVRAVAGNMDPPGFPGVSKAIDITIDGVRVHVSHGHEVGWPTPEKLLATYDADVIVHGHTHRQAIVNAEGRWVVNPGAAGDQNIKLVPSVARMTVEGTRVAIEIVELHIPR
jgi:putative phosphoesterase